MGRTLAIMFTMTTYGTWLRGDARGWISDGVLFPPNSQLERDDRERMNHEPFLFSEAQRFPVGRAIGESLRGRLQLRVLALTVQRWHTHYVVAATPHDAAMVAKCAKDAARWHLRLDRPLWSTDYDKRFCFDEAAVSARVNYVERHNLETGWPAKPWDFIEPWRS